MSDRTIESLPIHAAIAKMQGITMISGTVMIDYHDNCHDTYDYGMVRLPPEYMDFSFRAVYRCQSEHLGVFMNFLRDAMKKGIVFEIKLTKVASTNRIEISGYAGREHIGGRYEHRVAQTRKLHTNAD